VRVFFAIGLKPFEIEFRASLGEDVLDEARSHIGTDITDDAYRSIKAAYEGALTDPVRKENNRIFDKAIANYMSEVARNDAAKGSDRQGLENAADFRARAKARFDDGIERGVPLDQMFDPRSSEFIFNISPWERGLEVQLQDILEGLQLEGVGAERAPNTNLDLQRRPGETTEEWRKRTEGRL